MCSDPSQTVVKFMRRHNTGAYYWPDKEDVHVHPTADLILAHSNPQAVMENRKLVYYFKDNELEEITQNYVNVMLK